MSNALDETAALLRSGEALREDFKLRWTLAEAHVKELERELSEARLRVCTTVIGCGECERCRAVASETRLREALEMTLSALSDMGLQVSYSVAWDAGCAALAATDDGLPDAAHMNGAAPVKCPGPECKACNGEACDKCGKGSWNLAAPVCTHDAIQRHEAPSMTPTPRDLKVARAALRWNDGYLRADTLEEAITAALKETP